MSARAGAHRFVEPVDFPLVVVGRCVLLIFVVDRVLFVASVRLGRESAADGFFLGALGFAWRHRIRLLLVTPAQVITQLIRRSICLQIRRLALPLRLIKQGLAPFRCREPTQPRRRGS